jgi:hypothetical protein
MNDTLNIAFYVNDAFIPVTDNWIMWKLKKPDASGVRNQRSNGQLYYVGIAEVINIAQLGALRLQSTKLTLLLHFVQFQSFG